MQAPVKAVPTVDPRTKLYEKPKPIEPRPQKSIRRYVEPALPLFTPNSFAFEISNGDEFMKAANHEKSVKDIIASAAQAAEQEAAAAAAEAKAKADASAAKAARRKERAHRKAMAPQDKEALKEKRLLKLVGAVVVKCMSKYSKSFDRDAFKKYAKEVSATFLPLKWPLISCFYS